MVHPPPQKWEVYWEGKWIKLNELAKLTGMSLNVLEGRCEKLKRDRLLDMDPTWAFHRNPAYFAAARKAYLRSHWDDKEIMLVMGFTRWQLDAIYQSAFEKLKAMSAGREEELWPEGYDPDIWETYLTSPD